MWYSRRPVAQAVEHHVAHDRVVAVERVAGAAEVVVVALRGQHVVGRVVDAAIGDVGPCSLPSAVWLNTTSRMTSIPFACSSLTRLFNSSDLHAARIRPVAA